MEIGSPSTASADHVRVIHREALRLVLLGALAVAVFFLTRALAAHNREMSLRDGRAWYERGERRLEQGDVEGALLAFRNATAKQRGEKQYVLALARALASARQDEAASAALLALRESSPEDPEINLQLARLAAVRQDVSAASRYYHNALYAPWPAEQEDDRRKVRLELIDVLLTHDQKTRALSELLAMNNDLPNSAAARVEVGRRFLQAGDSRQALEQFRQALQIDDRSGAANAGAGQAAFQLGDYAAARTYLRAAPDSIPDVVATRALVTFLITDDPWGSRIGQVERQRRLRDALTYATQRLHDCAARPDTSDATRGATEALDAQARALAAKMGTRAIHEADTIEEVVNVVDRYVRLASSVCQPATPRDRALMTIAQRHGVGQH